MSYDGVYVTLVFRKLSILFMVILNNGTLLCMPPKAAAVQTQVVWLLDLYDCAAELPLNTQSFAKKPILIGAEL